LINKRKYRNLLSKQLNINLKFFKRIYLWISKHRIKTILISVALFWFAFSLPKPLFKSSYATIVYDKDGGLLGAKIARDGQWRFPETDSLPDKYKTCLVQYEDAYFYKHPGINPVSLFKAVAQDIKAGKIVRGGSTISMQVMRMARGNQTRNVYQKFMEILLALRLELSYSKDEILNLYASHAPFGGNVVGISAAAWRYYGRSAYHLSWGEAATLAVLPNAPSLIHPGKNRKLLRQKRNRLLDKLLHQKIIDSTTWELAIAEVLPGKPKPLPRLSPHLLDRVVGSGREGKRIYTTIDAKLQAAVNRIALRYYPYLSANKIYNMGILVNEVETGNILAYMGNVPPAAQPKNASVDMIVAPRSTGSVLKPFLYAWAYKDGLILPNSLLKDIPTQIAGYHPKNYNKSYDGMVPAGEALARSLNVPAVRLLRNYGLQKFKDNLQRLQLPTINKPADYYGLTLILGGAETRLLDMASAYSSMARVLNHYNQTNTYNKNDYFPVSFLPHKSQAEAPTDTDLFGAGNIWFVFQQLSGKDRPVEGSDWNLYRSARRIAWKTGTSFGHRDAWCVGITPKYTVSVWVGNATGEGRPGLTGTQTAAPIMFDVFKELPPTGWFQKPVKALKQANICRQTGYLASMNCPEPVLEDMPQNGERSKTCPYHQLIHLNKEGTQRVNTSCYDAGHIKTESFLVLPPVAAWYYKRKNPAYRDIPPWAPGCQPDNERQMDLIYPKRNVQIFIPKDFGNVKQKIVCKAANRNRQAVIYWHLDNRFLQTTRYHHQIEIYTTPGKHRLTLVDQNGEILVCPFEVVP